MTSRGPIARARGRLAAGVWLGAVAALYGLAAWAQTQPGNAPYSVHFEGIEAGPMLDAIQGLSDCLALRGEEAPASPIHLRRRAQRDAERFQTVLHSNAYYGGAVDFRIEAEEKPWSVYFTITPGKAYPLVSAQVDYKGDPPVEKRVLASELDLPMNEPARAQPIIQAESQLVAKLRQQGFPFARAVGREVIVDHGIGGVEVTYQVDAGPFSYFGETQVRGLETVRESVVLRALPWEPGMEYDSRLVQEARDKLFRTELFALTQIQPEGDAAGGAVPIGIDVKEARHRTVALGLEYRTDTGPGFRADWTHRNFRGKGNRLNTTLQLSPIEYSLEANYHLPYFRREDQTLTYQGLVGHFEPDAYTSDAVEGSVWLERKRTSRLTLGAGLGLRMARVEQSDEEDTFALFSTPLQARYDASDDRLNPTQGYRILVRTTPYVDVLNGATPFLKNEVVLTHYLPLGKKAEWVIAARLRIGMIGGVARGDVPPDIRYYSGGGGSVRGYAYQLVGPLDEDDDPIGGRSVTELALEIRRKITETIGVVAFVDGGSVFEAQYPDFSEDIQWGAGLGVRYFTPIGPLRFDVAVPLNKREVDDGFQIYLSVGQAF